MLRPTAQRIVLASQAMLIRVSLVLGFGLVAGCKGAGGKLTVDTPLVPYVAPDIDELTGIEPPDDEPNEPAEPTPEAAPPAKK